MKLSFIKKEYDIRLVASLVQQEYKNTALLLSKYRENPSRYCQTFRTGNFLPLDSELNKCID